MSNKSVRIVSLPHLEASPIPVGVGFTSSHLVFINIIVLVPQNSGTLLLRIPATLYFKVPWRKITDIVTQPPFGNMVPFFPFLFFFPLPFSSNTVQRLHTRVLVQAGCLSVRSADVGTPECFGDTSLDQFSLHDDFPGTASVVVLTHGPGPLLGIPPPPQTLGLYEEHASEQQSFGLSLLLW